MIEPAGRRPFNEEVCMRKKLLALTLVLTAAVVGTLTPQASEALPCFTCDPVTRCCWDFCDSYMWCY